ncbi:YCII-related domain superfamily protein [Xanthomonas arboricola pv. pruni str. MAFF 311562]|uniref:YCII-related domain superfamily protein n=1 Tax=Xanthomonas arboricola pv. pruni str. MAFF 311562 TaxID=1414836 RepID=W4SAU5_9XANT|nr:YCII-related domain superfamily protein [Xanthomonas arboricola pv. pruni str. MAFF 311562]
MATRYLVVAMRKPDFPADVVQPHRAFLDTLRAAGQLELTGGFSDGSGGAYVLINVASWKTRSRSSRAIHWRCAMPPR